MKAQCVTEGSLRSAGSLNSRHSAIITIMNLSPRGRHSEVYQLTENWLSVPRTGATSWIFLLLYLTRYQLPVFPARLYCNHITNIIRVRVSHLSVFLLHIFGFYWDPNEDSPSTWAQEVTLLACIQEMSTVLTVFSVVFLSQSVQMAV